ncbi:unannotated protein [freshwater metagenome]|uniref:Unannotated protein n=1 Tax=freshwater metagenome TaxID=449393 RepID=A0A6J7GM70_9ZZZZ
MHEVGEISGGFNPFGELLDAEGGGIDQTAHDGEAGENYERSSNAALGLVGVVVASIFTEES